MSVSVIIKWGGQEYSISTLSEEDTVLDLKQSIKSLTGVLPERQKLLGLKVKGKPAYDDVKLGDLKLKPNTKIMMMGTREESLEDVLAPPPENDDVVNDFDIEEDVTEVENREENLAKIARRVKDYKVEELNPPRPGKRLLVLDIDYTLFGESLKPRHMLLIIYIAMIRATILIAVSKTLYCENGLYFDNLVTSRGVKPLGVIWGKYIEFYNRKNTIMFDDIGRNFLMNPQNGLKVSHITSNRANYYYCYTLYCSQIVNVNNISIA
uniref:Ubiquitin-like domain-containing CTD phosphatase 1 n=1 Tax=Sinocyclocheilus grahami TaxID=75366 RepID=A0A672LM32_SINGR